MQGIGVKGGLFSAFSALAISAVAVKVLGAVYRIPLANILGTEGLGLYQMIFPIYSLLLILSSSAFPSAISKLIASERKKGDKIGEKRVVQSAKALLIIVGSLGSILLFIFSGSIANYQGISDCSTLYKIISPCVFIVAVIALYRGTNQGRLNMKVTAISQVIEQVIKMIVGLLLTYIFRAERVLAVSMAVLSVTISEIVTLIYVVLNGNKSDEGGVNVLLIPEVDKIGEHIRKLLKQALPMTIAFSIYPIVSVIESKVILQSLLGTASRVGQYGIFSGCVQTVIGIPISIINSLAIALIPTISASFDKKAVIESSFKIALMIIIPFFFAFLFLNNNISDVLYFRFSVIEKELLSKMLKYSSITMLLYAMDLFLSGALNGLGKPVLPMLTQIIGGCVRIALLYFGSFRYGIFGAIFASWAGYFIATIINLVYIISVGKLKLKKDVLMSTLIYVIICFAGINVFSNGLGSFVGLLLSVVWSMLCVLLAVYSLRIFQKRELYAIFKKE